MATAAPAKASRETPTSVCPKPQAAASPIRRRTPFVRPISPQVDVTFHGGGSLPSFPRSGYPHKSLPRGIIATDSE